MKNKYFLKFHYVFDNIAIFSRKNLLERILVSSDTNRVKNLEEIDNEEIRDDLLDKIVLNTAFKKIKKADKGTEFQKKVWEMIENIKFGKTWFYSDIGEKINSKAYQAIGTACGKNPYPLVVPCHRVVSKNGLGGYSEGIYFKKKLISYEKERRTFEFSN